MKNDSKVTFCIESNVPSIADNKGKKRVHIFMLQVSVCRCYALVRYIHYGTCVLYIYIFVKYLYIGIQICCSLCRMRLHSHSYLFYGVAATQQQEPNKSTRKCCPHQMSLFTASIAVLTWYSCSSCCSCSLPQDKGQKLSVYLKSTYY